MWVWLVMLICDLWIPITMILYGRMMWKHPPQRINALWGYHSRRSAKNMDTWLFAHDYCGRLWWRIGWCMLLPSFAFALLLYGRSTTVTGLGGVFFMALQAVILLSSMISTEFALKKKFH